MRRLFAEARRHSIMLGLIAAMLLIVAIGAVGMSASVLVAEQVQGSASAINVAGSLRRLSHRMGSIVMADAANRRTDHGALRDAMGDFERALAHEALASMLVRQPERPFAETYRQVRAEWRRTLRPMMEQELSFPGNPDDLARHNVLLADIDAFVARINAMVGQLEADAEERIQRFRNILGAALMLLLLLCAMAIHVIRRNIFVPLSGLLKGAERLAQGDFSVRVERVGPDELGRLGQIFNSTAGELSRSYGELERKIAEKMTELTASLSRKAEQERMLALQEERSIIARELHDSIAQALSYLKIQASLLAPLLSDPARSVEAAAVLSDMRNGIAAAYRQLRELLATFRLKMEGDFFELLDATANEYSQRGGLQVDLDVCLDQCHLTPNQEIHILQIVREALSNVLHHANATRVWITMRYIPIPSELRVTVADDGAGFDQAALLVGLHYGLAIMDERARELYGHLSVRPRPGGGTLVSLSFDPFNKLESVA